MSRDSKIKGPLAELIRLMMAATQTTDETQREIIRRKIKELEESQSKVLTSQ